MYTNGVEGGGGGGGGGGSLSKIAKQTAANPMQNSKFFFRLSIMIGQYDATTKSGYDTLPVHTCSRKKRKFFFVCKV